MINSTKPHHIDSTRSTTARPELSLSDQEIVARVQLGETALYGILVRRHNPRLYKFLGRILSSHDEVEDVMQEAHFRAMTHLSQFEGRSSFVTWLSRVMINEAYTHLRRRRPFQPLDSVSEGGDGRQKEYASASRNPEQHAIQQELREVLATAVDSLPELYRAVFTVRALEEASIADAATRLGVSEQCVKSRMLRARQLLKKKINRVAPAYGWRLTLPHATTERLRNLSSRSIRRSGASAKLGASGVKHDGTSSANSPYPAIRDLRVRPALGGAVEARP